MEEVNHLCPRCSIPLLYLKGGKPNKGFEKAHIYPLSPTNEEVELLRGEEKANEDLDSLDNQILLCPNCHSKFDKPRTVEDYRELLALKRKIQRTVELRHNWINHPIDPVVATIIRQLSEPPDPSEGTTELSLDFKTLDEKFDSSIKHLTSQKVRRNVATYFSSVRNHLIAADAVRDGIANYIGSQFRTYYLSLKMSGLSKQDIIEQTVEWLNNKTNMESRDACEVVVSFFVQNCEVLE